MPSAHPPPASKQLLISAQAPLLAYVLRPFILHACVLAQLPSCCPPTQERCTCHPSEPTCLASMGRGSTGRPQLTWHTWAPPDLPLLIHLNPAAACLTIQVSAVPFFYRSGSNTGLMVKVKAGPFLLIRCQGSSSIHPIIPHAQVKITFNTNLCLQ